MAAPPNTLGNCGSCVHYLVEVKAAKAGVCRRFPPQVFLLGIHQERGPQTITLWPNVGAGHGCGEYQQKGQDA